MMLKKGIALLLTLVMLFSLTVTSFAVTPEEELFTDLTKTMNRVADSVGKVKEIAADAQSAAALADSFAKFTQIAGAASSVLGVVNGSYNFLKMVGLIKDPVQEKLQDVISKLEIVDEKIDEMNGKLDTITSEMSKMEASVEFNARTQKAMTLQNNWRDFDRTYMEDGMDRLMSEYDAMLLNGLMKWCQNSESSARNMGGIDNRQLIVLYKKNGSEYELTFSAENSVPSTMTSEDRYYILPADCLPETFSWDYSGYPDNLIAAFAETITSALDIDPAAVTVYNDSGFAPAGGDGKIPEYLIQNLARDAVNTLVYRIAAQQVNNDANFTREVIRYWNNYCSHLLASDEGIDAIYKTFYLTHAFEGQVKEDLSDFTNRLIVKTGTYGVFVTGVLGLTRNATNDEKLSAVQKIVDAVDALTEGEANGLTGKDDYCYITNTRMMLLNLEFEGKVHVYTTLGVGNGKITYERTSAEALHPVINAGLAEGAYIIGDVNMLLLSNILRSNGINPTYEYLKGVRSSINIDNRGKIVTSYGSDSQFALDGKVAMRVRNCGGGDYFRDNSTIKSLSGGAETQYLTYRRKIMGNYYDLETGTLTSGATLAAMAAYGESHWYWIKDEAALMSGPADSAYFSEVTYDNYSGQSHDHNMKVTVRYNALMCEPLPVSELSGSGGYSPLNNYLELCAGLPEDEDEDVPADDPEDEPEEDEEEPEDEEDAQAEDAPVLLTGSGNGSLNAPKTGDERNPVLILSLLCVSTAVFLSVKRRKFNK